MKRNKAFTLIELLVVISIISLLSSVVLTSLNTARDKARYAKIAQDLRQAEIAFTQLYHERGCWPREGSTDCGGYNSTNPSIATLVADGPFGLKKYLSVAPIWPFSVDTWWYDNDGDETPVPCTGLSYAGLRLVVSNSVTAEQYRALNALFDRDANPDTTIARGCGRILFSGTTGTGELSFRLSETQ